MKEPALSEDTPNDSNIITAPITKVFDAWLDPSTLAKFMLPMPGMENSQVENEAHEGGTLTIMMQVGDSKVPHTGKYLEIIRPTKLVFTWESPESLDDRIVTLNLTELDDGRTNIELTL